MVALLWNGRPIECWIWQPLVKILFYASDYCGAFRIDEFSETRLRIEGRPFEVDLMCGSGNSLGLSEPKKRSIAGAITWFGWPSLSRQCGHSGLLNRKW